MKALKVLLIGLGAVVVLASAALAAVAVVVDGAFVKSRLELAMKEKHRTLRIEGEPDLKLFPVARIALGKTTLSEPASAKSFVALNSAEVAVRVMPLLSGEVVLETLKVAGLKVNLVRGRDGRMNFADLAGEPGARVGEEPEERRAPARLRVAEISIERGELSWRDEASGQELAVGDLGLKTGRLDGNLPGKVAFSARVTGKRPDVDIRAQASGAVRFDLARQEIRLDAVSVQAKGRLDRDTLLVEFSAPKVEVSPAKASGSAVTGLVRITGSKRNVDAKLRIAAVEGSAAALSIQSLLLDLDATDAGNSVKGQVSTPVAANLADRVVELPKIAARLTIASPKIPQRSVTLPIQATLKADLGKQKLVSELQTKFDESSIRANFGASKLEPLVATFGIEVDRLNMDRYLPQKQESNPNERIDLSALKGPTLSGKIEFGALTVRRVKLANVKAEVKLAKGKLEVSPHSAVLYGGTLAGTLSLAADGNHVALKETLQGVQVGPLLRDLAEQDRLEGRGNIGLDVATAGASVAALKKALGGSARVELRDGAVKGINLAETIQDARSVLGSKSAKANDPSKRTDFSEITASFSIRNGVAHNEDLQGKAPLLRLSGAGDVDIGNSGVQYTAKVSVVATSKGQGGRDLTQLAGVTVPVRLTGALEKPDVLIDFGELLAKSGVTLGRAVGSIGSTAGSATGSVRDKLKGLFGR